jgi:hypothetical protein
MCGENRLPLSELYKISEMVNDPYYKLLGRQALLQQRTLIGDPVDFSDQKEFGGIATVFTVQKAGNPASQGDYTIEDGIITFHHAGYYDVIMANAAIISHPLHGPTFTVAPVHVINLIAVTEIRNVPATAVAGTPLFLSATVIPTNATYQDIIWSVSDTGTTGATLTSRRLNTTAPGTVVVTATINDGITLDSAYTQNFTIEIAEFVPVTGIINVPTTAIVGTPLTLTGTVVPDNASYRSIVWSVHDAGATGATITNGRLNTTTPGAAVVTATIRDGAALDTAYTQNFTIKVESVGINEVAREVSEIKVYPNPTTGILEIESGDLIIHKIEVIDIAGRVVAARPFNILSVHYTMDISHLKPGTYFVKIITKQGEIVKKVVKR